MKSKLASVALITLASSFISTVALAGDEPLDGGRGSWTFVSKAPANQPSQRATSAGDEPLDGGRVSWTFVSKAPANQPAQRATTASTGEFKQVQLKDGSTVYIFSDGKMGMTNQYGQATRMQDGHVMQTQEGQTIVMRGDEVQRVSSVLAQVRGGA